MAAILADADVMQAIQIMNYRNFGESLGKKSNLQCANKSNSKKDPIVTLNSLIVLFVVLKYSLYSTAHVRGI
ncbi:MAG: hypothetical protein NMNS01_10880 [Nitrosomonas sp.]|nr:MAG: hypothetical protein NMNS01_10880 [Nitrosomonas sp.]